MTESARFLCFTAQVQHKIYESNGKSYSTINTQRLTIGRFVALMVLLF